MPSSVQEALSSPEAAQWKEAMDTEMDAMKSNHTWELLPLARGAKPLRVMWVFTLKGGTEGEGGEKLRFKARLVAKGCSQRPGLDFGEVPKPSGVCSLWPLLATWSCISSTSPQPFSTVRWGRRCGFSKQRGMKWGERAVGYFVG